MGDLIFPGFKVMRSGENRGGHELNEVIDIDNVIDKAIIKSLEYMCGKHGAKGLLAGAIKDTVRDKFGIQNEEDVQSRIRELHKRKILVEVFSSQERKDKKRVYGLNKNMEFNYICGLLPKECESRQVPIDVRRHHSVGLQEAIRNWIAYFPAPNAGFPFDPDARYQDDIKECQNHLLFADLENHLPEMGYNVCKEWRKYKEDLLKLQKMKERLLSLVENEIAKCFIGLKLWFIYNSYDGIGNYECAHIQKMLYNLVLDLSGRIPGAEAYDNYNDIIWGFQEHSSILKGKTIIWKGIDVFITVPGDKLNALEVGIGKFKLLVEDIIAKPHLIKEGKEIVEKVKRLQDDREKMTIELEDALQYYVIPGDCKYLAGY
jgi:hypothetical protein